MTNASKPSPTGRGSRHLWRGVRLVLALFFLLLSPGARADQVITKDGKTYTGKIMIDTDKAVLIGNPPYDPNSTLIQADDIKTIIYEEYHQAPPARRRRGLAFDFHLAGNFSSSKELSLNPAAALRLGGGFRFHPLIELGGGVEWDPGQSASGDGLSIANTNASRGYTHFWGYNTDFLAKIYPFFYKTKWRTEPFIVAGYGWSRLIPNNSGDSLKGSGWQAGFGLIHPLTKHLFLDQRFIYRHLTFDTVHFMGQEGGITPEVAEHQYLIALGLSYRL